AMNMTNVDAVEGPLSETFCAGVDIGGTKLAVGAIDRDGRVLRRRIAPTPSGPDKILETVASMIEDLGRPQAVGVGAPGIIDGSSGRVWWATDTIAGWAGTEVTGVLSALIGGTVVADNDVRMMAHGESLLGAGRPHPDALLVSVGTGVGGAVRRCGELIHGAHGTAGEIAHLYVGPGTRVCSCGRTGHLEAAVAGPGIAAAYTDHLGKSAPALEQVAESMRAGDPLARTVIEDAAVILGRALAGLVVALDVGAVIIAGGVLEIGDAWLSPLREALHAEVFPSHRQVPVLAAELGSEAGLVGAGLMAFEALPKRVPT
ncbi:MAG: ROK family protein, partial [Solirubrobacteraceae bacterium]